MKIFVSISLLFMVNFRPSFRPITFSNDVTELNQKICKNYCVASDLDLLSQMIKNFPYKLYDIIYK